MYPNLFNRRLGTVFSLKATGDLNLLLLSNDRFIYRELLTFPMSYSATICVYRVSQLSIHVVITWSVCEHKTHKSVQPLEHVFLRMRPTIPSFTDWHQLRSNCVVGLGSAYASLQQTLC